jgi:penicillin-binding protein 2B
MLRKSPYMNKGAGWLHIIFALLFFVMIVAFLYIQITGTAKGVDVQAHVEEKELHKKKGTLPGVRGTIYTSDEEPLAKDVASYDIYAVLTDEHSKGAKPAQHVVDKKMTAAKLAPILKMSEREIFDILNKDANRVEFGKNGRELSSAVKDEIVALKLPGIFFDEGLKRYYPHGQYASHTIGYMGPDEDGQIVGKMGLEQSLEEFLKKEDGKVSYKADGKGVILPSVQKDITPPTNGKNVYLTLDSRIQHLVEEALNDAQEKYQPERMTAIVVDPKTGQVLGMGNRPSFDPNLRNIENYLNDPIEAQIEPGSTMKIFALAAAIDAGKYNGNARFQSGQYDVGDGQPIRDHNNGQGWGSITYNEGIQRSSNVAMAYLGEKVGFNRIKDYYESFGLFKETGIELPGEKDGELKFGTKRDQISTMFGQSSTITPIQMVQATTAIANDGKMMKPYIIEKIVDPDTNETIEKHEPTQVGTPISKEAAKETREILETVVTAPNGTGRMYAMDGYSIAGKTGTSQVVDPKTKQYMSGHGNYLLSFIGMAPKDEPEVVVYVNVLKPKLESDVYEAQPVSEIFKHITSGALTYLNVKPVAKEADQLVDKHSVTLPDFKNVSIEEAKQQVIDQGLIPVVLGDGDKVVDQEPKADSKVIAGNKILLLPNGEIKMEDISGWSIGDVMKLCQLLGIELHIEGTGYAFEQSIGKGETIAQDSVLTVKFKSPRPGG